MGWLLLYCMLYHTVSHDFIQRFKFIRCVECNIPPNITIQLDLILHRKTNSIAKQIRTILLRSQRVVLPQVFSQFIFNLLLFQCRLNHGGLSDQQGSSGGVIQPSLNLTRLQCEQWCVLRLRDIVGHVMPRRVNAGIKWGQTAPIAGSQRCTHVHLVWESFSLRVELKTM